MHADFLVIFLGSHSVLLAAVDEQDSSEQSSYTDQDTKSKTSLSTAGHA